MKNTEVCWGRGIRCRAPSTGKNLGRTWEGGLDVAHINLSPHCQSLSTPYIQEPNRSPPLFGTHNRKTKIHQKTEQRQQQQQQQQQQ
eukprot:1158006-Pelagomonas_calceolata.AAC.14